MKKLRKSGFISWCRVRIIVGHLDCSLFNNLGLCTLLALIFLDARAQVILVGTVGAPEGRKLPVPSSSLVMHVGTEVLVTCTAMVARQTANNLYVLEMIQGSSDL